MVEAVHEGYIDSALIGQNPLTQSTSVQRLMNSWSVQQYKWVLKSMCGSSLNENAQFGSDQTLSEKPFFLLKATSFSDNFLIQAKMSKLGHFRHFPMDLVYSALRYSLNIDSVIPVLLNGFVKRDT